MAGMKRDAEHYSRQVTFLRKLFNIQDVSLILTYLPSLLLEIYLLTFSPLICVMQEHIELEKRYRELTDLLVCYILHTEFLIKKQYVHKLILNLCYILFQYHKQTQLESMASEKAALEFQLEKELRRLQEAQARVLFIKLLHYAF